MTQPGAHQGGERGKRGRRTRLVAAFNRNFRELHASLLAMSDAVMIFFGFLLGYLVRFRSGLFAVRHAPGRGEWFVVVPWLVLIWVFASPTFEIYLYRGGHTWTRLFIKVMEAVLLATGVSLVMNQLSGVKHSRMMIVLGWAFSLVLIGIARYAVHRVAAALRARGIGVVNVAVVGAIDGTVLNVIRTMQTDRILGYRMAGVINDRPGPPELAEWEVPYLGTMQNIRGIVKSHAIDELVIALPHFEREKILEILSEFETDAVAVRIISSVVERLTRPIEIEEIGNVRLLALREHPLTGWGRHAKRAIDAGVSLAGLVLLLPLFGAIAAAVKLTSPGPVFYKQVRVGRDDRPFTMVKFRSMRVEAEKDTGPVWASRDDPRCTPVGRFLRRTSLDELPQLLNVLVGQMSLVGPRPERPEFVEEFRKQVPKYLRRHKVKAGLTGWAQALGWRGDTSLEKRIQCDLWYIANWSLSLDLEIMLKTLREVVRRTNAR